MKRTQLEHVIRAAADVSDDDEIVVIGSQSILGRHPDAPQELCVSMEADVYSRSREPGWALTTRAAPLPGAAWRALVRPVQARRARGRRAEPAEPASTARVGIPGV
ncbi:MAG TPA: hypothetical protein VF395_05105 [Polyangiaceae bacterium]